MSYSLFSYMLCSPIGECLFVRFYYRIKPSDTLLWLWVTESLLIVLLYSIELWTLQPFKKLISSIYCLQRVTRRPCRWYRERPCMFEMFLESASASKNGYSLSYSTLKMEVISVINLKTTATIKVCYSGWYCDVRRFIFQIH